MSEATRTGGRPPSRPRPRDPRIRPGVARGREMGHERDWRQRQSPTKRTESSGGPFAVSGFPSHLTWSTKYLRWTMNMVADVRAFNRFYTEMIGVLQAGLLDTPYSLTEARVLFELGTREVSEVAVLRELLDLDP